MLIIKAPFSGGSLGKNKGCEKAPDEIVKQLESCYTSEGFQAIKPEIKGLKLDSQNIEASFNVIEELLTHNDQHFMLLGGDHSITYPAFRAFSKQHQNPGLVVLDAHPDVMNDFSPPTHEDWLKVLISEGVLRPENIILVGIRNPDQKELAFIKQNNIRVFWMKHCHNLGINELTSVLMENCRKFPAMYLSIDIDAVDPAFAPATGYPEPGGFSSRELFHMLQRLALLNNLRAFDIVEINPERDLNGITARLGARIVRELLKNTV